MRIGQTSVIVFISRFISSALGFVATVYFARVLGAEILGYYALTIALVAWLKLGGNLGVSGAITKRISEGTEEPEYATAGAIAIGAFAVGLSILVFTFADAIERYVGAEVASFVILLLVMGLANALVNAILKGEHQVHISGLLSPLKIGTRSAAQIALVVAGLGLSGMLIGHAIGWLISVTVGLVYLSIRIRLPEKYHFRQIYDYAKYSWLGGIESRSFNDVDVVVLGMFVSSTLVGIYSVAWSISKFLTLFGVAIRQALFPEISKADTEDDHQYVAKLITDGIAYSGLVLIPGLVGGAILTERLLRIYGPEFEQGTAVLVLLILACLFHGYQQQLLNSLNAVDRPDRSFRINAVFIVMNVVGNVALVYWIGWVGAAVATAFSAAFGMALAYRALHAQIPFTMPWGEISRQGLAALAMGGIVYGSLWIENTYRLLAHNFATVFILVGLGAATYFFALLTISPKFRRTVSNNLPVDVPLLAGRA